MMSDVELVKSKLDLVEVMSAHIKLIPAGASYKALCPFHHEKSPSLIISPARQIWRCFGCNEGGDAIAFVMKIEGLGFREALAMLAQQAGVTLTNTKREEPEERDRRERLVALSDAAAKYWHRVLLESPSAASVREYLQKRGINQASIEEWCIGYSPAGWDTLIKQAATKGYRDRELLAAGLVIAKDNRFYDRFRERLMFPIRDLYGRTVGFGGRTLKADDVKYINSPQSEIYNKSAILYGLDRAKEAIRTADLCILVEGYMDVIPVHQAGFKNVVAISGTALTPEQLRLIKRFTTKIALALDMDTAGQMAAERSVVLAWQQGFEVTYVKLPHSKDPGECVTAKPDDFRDAVAAARPVMEHFIETALERWPLDTPGSQTKAATYLLEKIAAIANPIERHLWLTKAAQILGVPDSVLREATPRSPQAAPAAAEPELPQNQVAPKLTKERGLSEQLLAAIVARPGRLGHWISLLDPEEIPDRELAALYKQIILFYTTHTDSVVLEGNGPQIDLFPVLREAMAATEGLDAAAETLLQTIFLLSEAMSTIDDRNYEAEVTRLIAMAKAETLTLRTSVLQRELAAAEARGDREAIDRIYTELAALLRKKSIV